MVALGVSFLVIKMKIIMITIGSMVAPAPQYEFSCYQNDQNCKYGCPEYEWGGSKTSLPPTVWSHTETIYISTSLPASSCPMFNVQCLPPQCFNAAPFLSQLFVAFNNNQHATVCLQRKKKIQIKIL